MNRQHVGVFLRSPKGSSFLVGAFSGLSFVSGGALSYILTKKALEAKYDEIARWEIAQAKHYYRRLNKAEEYSDPTKLVMEYGQKLQDLGYGDDEEDVELLIVDETTELDDVSEHVDDAPDEEFDYEAELQSRSEDHPYIISHEEYFQGDPGYVQVSLTYFEDDDVLVDERETPVENVDALVGNLNVTRFGYGSKDNNIVYVRNDRLELDIEVVRNKGNYARNVLGFIEHSEPRGRPRRFRSDYE